MLDSGPNQADILMNLKSVALLPQKVDAPLTLREDGFTVWLKGEFVINNSPEVSV